MNRTKPLPASIRERARLLFEHTVNMTLKMTPEETEKFPGFTIGKSKPDLAVIRAYVESMADEKSDGVRFHNVAHIFSVAARNAVEGSFGKSLGVSSITEIDPGYLVPPAADRGGDDAHERLVRQQLREWLQLWHGFDRVWQGWTDLAPQPAKLAAATSQDSDPVILSANQSKAANHLEAMLAARRSLFANRLSPSLLPRWSVPFLIGPTSIGKSFVCEEVARRAGFGFRRWEIGSWLLAASRGQGVTLEQIAHFIEENPQGCIVYLAGLDTLASARQGSELNAAYMNSVVSEVESFLATYSRRGAGGSQNVQIIVSGRFPELSGETDIGTPTGADAWKRADTEALSEARSVAKWLHENSGVPTGILRHLSVEPIVIERIRRDEALRIAARIRSLLPEANTLPRSLDGLDSLFTAISTDALATALCGPQGWRGMSAMFEQTMISAYELTNDLPTFVAELPPTPKGEGGSGDAQPVAK